MEKNNDKNLIYGDSTALLKKTFAYEMPFSVDSLFYDTIISHQIVYFCVLFKYFIKQI
jgi:hypothetical protein